MANIKIGILGGAGYTGGELIRLLIHHPNAEIKFVHSKSHAGSLISNVHTDLIGETDLKFVDSINNDIDVVFLCVGHGEAKKLISEFDLWVKVIDLSQDFRIESDKKRSFIYGLPELNREKISEA